MSCRQRKINEKAARRMEKALRPIPSPFPGLEFQVEAGDYNRKLGITITDTETGFRHGAIGYMGRKWKHADAFRDFAAAVLEAFALKNRNVLARDKQL